jgi:stalled ribosome rescue protein Dom34
VVQEKNVFRKSIAYGVIFFILRALWKPRDSVNNFCVIFSILRIKNVSDISIKSSCNPNEKKSNAMYLHLSLEAVEFTQVDTHLVIKTHIIDDASNVPSKGIP